MKNIMPLIRWKVIYLDVLSAVMWEMTVAFIQGETASGDIFSWSSLIQSQTMVIRYNIWYTEMYNNVLYYCRVYFQWGLWDVLPEELRLLQISLTFHSSVFECFSFIFLFLIFILNALCLIDVGCQYLLYLCNFLKFSF